MGGNRKHGFARGNASGRNGQTHGPRWFCDGYQREHGGKVCSTVIYGLVYCDRQASRIETARSERRLNAIMVFAQLPEWVLNWAKLQLTPMLTIRWSYFEAGQDGMGRFKIMSLLFIGRGRKNQHGGDKACPGHSFHHGPSPPKTFMRVNP